MRLLNSLTRHCNDHPETPRRQCRMRRYHPRSSKNGSRDCKGCQQVAKGCREDHGIASFIPADDVHPPFQFTEGVRLRVLDSEVRAVRDALEDAAMLSQRVPADDKQTEARTFSVAWPVRMTAWAYMLVFVLVIAAIVVGLLLSSIA